jgi:hypothetical protein
VKRIGTAAAAVAILLVVAGPAAAQEEFNYPPGLIDITVSDTTVACPGSTVTISGTGFADDVEIGIFFDDLLVATVFPTQEGTFSATIDVPEAAAGTHTITAVQVLPDGTVLEESATVTCVAAAPGLAVTGGNISMGLLLLAGLIVVGAVALVAGRRRSRTSA